MAKTTCLHNQEMWIIDVELYGMEEVLDFILLNSASIYHILVFSAYNYLFFKCDNETLKVNDLSNI